MAKSVEIEVEKTGQQACDLMAWCRENSIPALVCWLEMVGDGENSIKQNLFIGTRSYKERAMAHAMAHDALEYKDPLIFFIRVRERDATLFSLRAL
jgi:hypothetical protein